MLEQLGRGGVLVSGLAPHTLGREEIIRVVNDVSRAARILWLRGIDALIVLARGTGLAAFIASGWGLPSRPMRWRLSCRRRRGPSRWPERGSSSAACRKKN